MQRHLPPQQDNDPLGLREQLRAALGQDALGAFDGPDEVDESARQAAYALAVALGRCRLFGVEPREDDGTLPPALALAAASHARGRLAAWADRARTLPDRFDRSDCEVEAESFCLDLLEARMETWALFVAIDEAYEDCLQSRDRSAAELGKLLGVLLDAVAELDGALDEQKHLLCLAADTCLLENWRRLLVPPYGQALPWWLDGTLEDILHDLQQAALFDWPAPRPASPSLGLLGRQALSGIGPVLSLAAETGDWPRLSEGRQRLNTTLFAVEGDPGTRVHFDVVQTPSGEEWRIYLAPPEEAGKYTAVRISCPGAALLVRPLRADYARFALAGSLQTSVVIELLTRDGVARRVQTEAP